MLKTVQFTNPCRSRINRIKHQKLATIAIITYSGLLQWVSVDTANLVDQLLEWHA